MRLAIGVMKPFKLLPKQVVVLLSHYGSCRAPGHGIMLRITNSWKPDGDDSVRSRIAARPAKLGDRWPEYQGARNWDGLLDPLDDDLRSEILRYGGFVEAAYRAFEFDTSSPNYAMCQFSRGSVLAQSGLGGSGYKLTRNLRATCGIRVPKWIHRGAPKWLSTRSSWIGYVAVCNDREEIARLGRRDVVIAFRGTATCLEWAENFRATLTCMDSRHVDRENHDQPMVESGFLSMYKSGTPTCPSLQETVREEIQKILQSYGDEPLGITIVGHSLGAALATLAAYDITTTFDHPPLVTVYSFGGPRVGNRSFRSKMDRSGAKVLRIVNTEDVITKIPGLVIDNNELAEGKAVHVAGLPAWLKKRVEDARILYADVGRELRLSSRESPYLCKGNAAICHDLKTYLHLVNGYVSATCLFKATARGVLNSAGQRKQLLFR
ncbi:Phospholipase A(1) [Bertholletia excelsa]